MKLIDRKTALEAYKFGNVEDILDRVEEEIQKAENPETQSKDSEVQNAELALKQIMEGKDVQANPQDDHEIAMGIGANFLKSKEVQANPEIMKKVMLWLNQHRALLEQQGGGRMQTPQEEIPQEEA
jgi:hypothetical protein